MTNKQTLAIKYMIEHPDWTDDRVSKECNGTPAWLCNLKKKPEFKEALEKGLHEVWKDASKYAVDTMINLTKNGDREAAKFILQCNGYNPDTNINVKGDIHIDIDYGE